MFKQALILAAVSVSSSEEEIIQCVNARGSSGDAFQQQRQRLSDWAKLEEAPVDGEGWQIM